MAKLSTIVLFKGKRQMRDVVRQQNVKRYIHTPMARQNEATSMLTQNLPMVAMFLKSKPIAWATLFLACQGMLNEPMIKDPSDESQPAIFKIMFAVVAIAVSYIDILFPNTAAPLAS